MSKNYWKTTWRSLLKHKVFALINIIGLAIGISAAMVIYLVVRYDFSFDKQHPDGERIYRVVSDFDFGGQLGYNSGVPAPLGGAIRNNLTGVSEVAPFYLFGNKVKVTVPKTGIQTAEFKKQNQIIMTDGSYFNLFKYKWIAGSAGQSFKQPFKVVLTASRAQLYFPGVNYAGIVGKQLIYDDSIKVTVSGVVADMKQNTDFTFHDFISLASADYNKNLNNGYSSSNWNITSPGNQLFIKVNEGASVNALKKQIKKIYLKNVGPSKWANNQSFGLQPLSDLHFDSSYDTFNQRIANKNVLYGLLGVAAFLLLLGCINFINLNTAQSTQRAKEIGIRKTIGGTRKQLIAQFLTETFILTSLATLLSMVLVKYLLSLFSQFIPAGITYAGLFTPGVICFIVCLVVLITLLSGLYPAVMMSAYQPVQIIKNQREPATGKGNTHYLRKGLTVTQFVIAQVFVMGTLLVSSQLNYLLNKDLGFKKDAVLFIKTPYSEINSGNPNVLANKLAAMPQIASVSLGDDPPSSPGSMSTHMLYKDGKKENESVVYLKFGDEHYFNTYGLKVIAGRSPQMRDSSTGIVINQTYAKELGFQNPAQAVGKVVTSNFKQLQIIGVVKDFHQTSLRAPIMPMALATSNVPNYSSVVHISLKTHNTKTWASAISQIKTCWQQVYPNSEFEYQFVDDTIAKFYTAEQNTGKLLNWATGLSVFISCLGLLGLAIFTTNQRTKEIGIRKVMGATVSQIVSMLSLDFVKLILLAFVIALPIAWYGMNQWLQNFAYHTTLSIWLFAGAIGITIAIALLTMSLQTFKAALANPVKSLRSE